MADSDVELFFWGVKRPSITMNMYITKANLLCFIAYTCTIGN